MLWSACTCCRRLGAFLFWIAGQPLGQGPLGSSHNGQSFGTKERKVRGVATAHGWLGFLVDANSWSKLLPSPSRWSNQVAASEPAWMLVRATTKASTWVVLASAPTQYFASASSMSIVPRSSCCDGLRTTKAHHRAVGPILETNEQLCIGVRCDCLLLVCSFISLRLILHTPE